MQFEDVAAVTFWGNATHVAKGYVFVCTDKSEAECFERSLFGTSNLNADHVMEIEPGDTLFLLNIQSDRLYGPFTATTKGLFNVVPDAWSGRYPYQVQFGPISKSECLEKAKKVLDRLGIRSNMLLDSFEVDALTELTEAKHNGVLSLIGEANVKAVTKPLLEEMASRLQQIRQTNGKSSAKSRLHQKPILEATTLWDFPTQSYGASRKGDNKYPGVTPAFIIWNLVRRYTNPGDLVVDPMCGSGTTLDVCKEEGRQAIGYDIASTRPDIIQNDARAIPLPDNTVDLVFIDSPYGDNIKYNPHPDSIGNISAEDTRFYDELEKVMKESCRILKPGKILGWLIGDQWVKKRFTPVGFLVYERLSRHFEPVDIICVVRRSQSSNTSVWYNRARRFNFYLRGFKYLLIVKKPEPGRKKQISSRRVHWAYYER